MKSTKKTKQPEPALIPDGYVGPAYQLPDGRTLFVAKYLGYVWAICYLDYPRATLTFYRSPALRSTYRDEASTRAALVIYGETNNLVKIQ